MSMSTKAIPFLNVLLRLTGVTLFLRRLGSVSGGGSGARCRLTVRPWAIRSLWERSPYSQDAVRGQMMADGDIAGWAGYLKLLIELLVGDGYRSGPSSVPASRVTPRSLRSQ